MAKGNSNSKAATESAAENKDAAARTANAQKTTAKLTAVKAPALKGSKRGGGGKSKFATPAIVFAEAAYAHLTAKEGEGFGLLDILNGNIIVQLGDFPNAEAALAAEKSPFFSTTSPKIVGYAQNIQIAKWNADKANADNQVKYTSTYVPATDTTEADKSYHCIITAKNEADARKAVENYNNFVNQPYNDSMTIGQAWRVGPLNILNTWTGVAPKHNMADVVFAAEEETTEA